MNMVYHYQDEIINFLEKSSEVFGLDKINIYVQFVIMVCTLSFLNLGESTKLFIIPAIENYPVIQTISFTIGLMAKFFTGCVGAIATFKFVSEVSKKITNKFKK